MKYIRFSADSDESCQATRADIERALGDYQPHQRAAILRRLRAGEVITDRFGFCYRRAADVR